MRTGGACVVGAGSLTRKNTTRSSQFHVKVVIARISVETGTMSAVKLVCVFSIVCGVCSPLPAWDSQQVLQDWDHKKGCVFPPKEVMSEAATACAYLTTAGSVYSEGSKSKAFFEEACKAIVNIATNLCRKKETQYVLHDENPEDICNDTVRTAAEVATFPELRFLADGDNAEACVNVCPAGNGLKTSGATLCSLLMGLARAKQTLGPSEESLWREMFEEFQDRHDKENCTFPPKHLMETDVNKTCAELPSNTVHADLQKNLCLSLMNVSSKGCKLHGRSESALNDYVNTTSVDVCQVAQQLKNTPIGRIEGLEFAQNNDRGTTETCPYVCKENVVSSRVCRLLLFAVMQPLLAPLQNAELLPATLESKHDEATDLPPDKTITSEERTIPAVVAETSEQSVDTTTRSPERIAPTTTTPTATNKSREVADTDSNVVLSKDKGQQWTASTKFMLYIVGIMVVVVLLYVLFSYRTTLINWALASQESRGRQPSSSEAQYSPLQPTVEDVMPALKKTVAPKKHAY